MINLLAWLFFIFKDDWWQKRHQDSDYSDEEEDDDKSAISPVDGTFLNGKYSVKKKVEVDKEIVAKTSDDFESSLDDILRDASWKAVDGSLQSCSKDKIEEIEGYFVVSNSSNDLTDYPVHVELSKESQILGKDIERINSFTESFGNVDDGDHLKKAYIIKRNYSVELRNSQSTAKVEECSKHLESRKIDFSLDEYLLNFEKSRKKKNEIVDDKEIIAIHENEQYQEKNYGEASNMQGEFVLEDDDGNLKDVIEGGGTKVVLDVSKNKERNPEYLKDKCADLSFAKTTEKSQMSVTLKGVQQEVAFVQISNEPSVLQRNDSWDLLEMKKQESLKNEEREETRDQKILADSSHNSPNKLKFDRRKYFDQTHSESPKAEFQDFEIVMRRRKLHTDTMQKVSDTFGEFGHRQNKIDGSPSKSTISARWKKVQKAVYSKKYLEF